MYVEWCLYHHRLIFAYTAHTQETNIQAMKSKLILNFAITIQFRIILNLAPSLNSILL